MNVLRLALLASHGGTNVQAILDACAKGDIKAEPVLVISNNSTANVVNRARQAGIKTLHLSSTTHPNAVVLDNAIRRALQDSDVDLVVLAGYNKRLGPSTVSAYRHRILNIHPGLLPKYGGAGMYGLRVHQAVLDNDETESGATVHLVDEEYDHGPTIAELRVKVLPGDSPETLSERIKTREHELYVDVLRRIAAGEIELPAR